MPLISLSEQSKDHLRFLSSVPPEVVREFAKIAVQFLRSGDNKKAYAAAAERLEADEESIQHAVEGMAHLFAEGSRCRLSEFDFGTSVVSAELGLEEGLRQLLTELYLEHTGEIRRLLFDLSMGIPQYKNLAWRLDVQVASRSLRHHVVPDYTLQLSTDDGRDLVLMCDPANMKHLASELRGAVGELRSSYTRRILRNVK